MKILITKEQYCTLLVSSLVLAETTFNGVFSCQFEDEVKFVDMSDEDIDKFLDKTPALEEHLEKLTSLSLEDLVKGTTNIEVYDNTGIAFLASIVNRLKATIDVSTVEITVEDDVVTFSIEK